MQKYSIIEKASFTIYKYKISNDDNPNKYIRVTFQLPKGITSAILERGWKSGEVYYVYDQEKDIITVCRSIETQELQKEQRKSLDFVTKDDFEGFKKEFMADYVEFKAWKKAKHVPPNSSIQEKEEA